MTAPRTEEGRQLVEDVTSALANLARQYAGERPPLSAVDTRSLIALVRHGVLLIEDEVTLTPELPEWAKEARARHEEYLARHQEYLRSKLVEDEKRPSRGGFVPMRDGVDYDSSEQ